MLIGRMKKVLLTQRQKSTTKNDNYQFQTIIINEKKTTIAPNQVFVPKIAFKDQSHKNKFH